MKKFVSTFFVVMIIIGICNCANCEEDIYDYDDNLINWTCFDCIENDFNMAYSQGEKIYDDMYLYNGCIYSAATNIYINASEFGFSNPGRKDIAAISDHMKDVLNRAGVKCTEVNMVFAGQYESEDFYEITIMTTTNLNEFKGNEEIGTGFVADGISYYGMKVLCRII